MKFYFFIRIVIELGLVLAVAQGHAWAFVIIAVLSLVRGHLQDKHYIALNCIIKSEEIMQKWMDESAKFNEKLVNNILALNTFMGAVQESIINPKEGEDGK